MKTGWYLLRRAQWLINDQFTPGLGGALHLDVYIGEEDRVNFTKSAMYTTLANVKIARLSDGVTTRTTETFKTLNQES